MSFLVTFVVTPAVIKAAQKCNCVDNPGARRFHKKTTPRWGGLAFFIGVLPAVVFLAATSAPHRTFLWYLVASSFLIILGAIDDLKNLGWKVKIGGMFVAASVVMFGDGVMINQIGTYGSIGKIELGYLSVPFTFFSIVGLTNAINLIDGLNGLAGGTLLLAFLFMGIAGMMNGNHEMALLCFAFSGALAGFLRYNFANAKIFMGDSGSLFLGFSVAVVAILLTQNPQSPIEPTFPVLVLLLPIFDTLRVMIVRIFSCKNPFVADKSHLHHLIVRKKISSSKAVAFLWGLTAVFGILALLLIRHSSVPLVFVILSFSLLLSFFADALSRRDRTEKTINHNL